MKTLHSIAVIFVVAVASTACSVNSGDAENGAEAALATAPQVRLTSPVFADGVPLQMSFAQAQAHCTAIGLRLPTIREYVEWATAHGAKGIRETAFPNVLITDPRVEHEHELAYADAYLAATKLNADGVEAIDFYYKGNGYISQHNESGVDFWTSTPYPHGPGESFYTLSGSTGYMTASGHLGPNGVRCVLLH